VLTALARKSLDARHREWAASKAEGQARESGSRHDSGLDDAPADPYVPKVLNGVNQLGALLSVVVVDVVLAGDNAIVVGMAAAGLPVERRRTVIILGIAVATVLRILLAYFAVQLLAIIGMTLAGGVLLLWVAWKMYREFRQTRVDERIAAAGDARCRTRSRIRQKSAGQALTQIVLADVSMSLDNVLAVAGIARGHFELLAFGLVLSVALMGVASTYIARLLDRHFWISWIGLGIITFVALRMIWEGSTEVLRQTAGLTLPGF
jgi:YjbE family integral membrane protein